MDRLHVIAVDVGEKAEKQGKLALDLSRQADEAHQEVVEVNTRLKKLMVSQSDRRQWRLLGGSLARPPARRDDVFDLSDGWRWFQFLL